MGDRKVSNLSSSYCESQLAELTEIRILISRWRNDKGEFPESKIPTKKSLASDLKKIYETLVSTEKVMTEMTTALVGVYTEKKALQTENKALLEEKKNFLFESNKLKSNNDRLQEYRNIFDKFADHTEDLKKNNQAEDIKIMISEEVKNTLPGIMKSVVTDITSQKNFGKSWADVVKGSQDQIKEEMGKTFRTTLQSALKENQGEILEKTLMKQETDQYEKEHRSRNVVISNVPESESKEIPQKIADDLQFIIDDLNFDESHVVKCFRVGLPSAERNSPSP